MIHARNGERIIEARTVSVDNFSAFFSLLIFLVSMVFDLLSLSLFSIFVLVHCQSSSLDDASVMMDLRESLNSPSSLGWTDLDPCKWPYVNCSVDGRVTWIGIGSQNLTGYLPPSLANLTALQLLDVGSNNLGGSLPSLADGLSSLRTLLLSYNNFSSIPSDFFLGMTSLETVILDNNGFSPQPIPDSLRSASNLKLFAATACYFTGKIPDFLGFARLTGLYLAFNNLEGGLPATFSGTSIRYVYLNSQQSTYKLNGSIAVIENMPNLMEVWLEANSFSGPLPDISGLTELRSLKVRDNGVTGLVPASFLDHPSLLYVSLTNNLLQGPTPKFVSDVTVHMEKGSNSFCLSDPGVACDPRVNTLLSIAQSVGYPTVFAKNWKGNEPCKTWFGVDCQNGNITVINFSNLSLTGTISPNFSLIISLQILVLANNNLTGTIPNELTTLPNLRELDVSNNLLSGKIPSFKSNVVINTDGNSNISTDGVFPAPVIPGTPLKTEVIVALVIGGFFVVLFVGILIYCLYRGKQKHSKDLQVIEVGRMAISIHVLKNATNNFGQENILGRGGFGTVYKGELHDGTKIAVKRMESGVVSERGWDQFESEIVVLSKVRHRHLVCLLGYCLDGNERLLVYEYMPQGSLCRHLFRWKEEGLKPLEWLKRLTIALDVARGVEYLHGLAHQSFIHRDLKPSNILLGHDMRAKVADFGFVRLAPDGKSSVLTRLAGTFGYLAPEYAMTGRLTKKIDVFSFGVILMQLITGRKALVETQQDECIGLVSWFRKMCTQEDAFHKAIDTTINLDEETLAGINTVAELAGHCCTKKPSQRPDMAHAVNVLSSLIEFWKPSDLHSGEGFGSSGELKPKDHSPAYPNEWL